MDKDTLKLRWAKMAEELWALGVGASLSKSESWSEGQGPGHRARPAVVGDRMWEEMGMLVPCTAAGSWLSLRTIPEGAWGPGGSSEEWGEKKVLGGQPAPDPAPFQACADGQPQGC